MFKVNLFSFITMDTKTVYQNGFGVPLQSRSNLCHLQLYISVDLLKVTTLLALTLLLWTSLKLKTNTVCQFCLISFILKTIIFFLFKQCTALYLQ